MASVGGGLIGEQRLDPDAAEAAGELAGADGGKNLDRRDVERLRQRFAHGHRAVVAFVEVLGRVDAEAHRAVLDQRLRVGDAGLEGEAVDERLQGRARRAHGGRHVDGAEAGVVEIAGRADVGDDLARRVIDARMAADSFCPKSLVCSSASRLQRRLHAAVDGEPVHASWLAPPSPPIRTDAGRSWERRGARAAPARGVRARLRPAEITPAPAARAEHAVAGGARGLAGCGRGGAPRAIAAAPRAARPRRPTGGAAPCRSRRARRRARPRCCRRRARAADRARGSRCFDRCRSSCSAPTIWRSLAAAGALVVALRRDARPAWSASSRPTRCGRSATSCQAARTSARASTPGCE